MSKRKNLIIAGLEPEYFYVFDSVAEGLDLTRSQFLISLMIQNGVIQGGLDCVIPELEYQNEWRDQLVHRQFEWANSI